MKYTYEMDKHIWEHNSLSSHILSHLNNFKWKMVFIQKQCKFSWNCFMPFMKFVSYNMR